MKKNVVIYTRDSIDEQREQGYSLQHQEVTATAYCKLKEYNVLNVYIEDYSAKSFIRPEWKKLMTFIKSNKGLVNKLVFLKWDRFSRNAYEAMGMIKELQKLNVFVECIEQPLDLTIPENLLLLNIYLTAPEIWNTKISIRTKAGMRHKMKQGYYIGKAPLGYKNSRDEKNNPLLRHSDSAALIKEAFEKFATGTYQKEILLKELYEKGLKVSKNQFCLILENPIYCGKIRLKAFGDEPEEILQGKHEPIVTEELFYQVQDVIAGQRQEIIKCARVNLKFPLKGFLDCPNCGKKLNVSSSRFKGGRCYSYYHCPKACKVYYESNKLHHKFKNLVDKILQSVFVIPKDNNTIYGLNVNR